VPEQLNQVTKRAPAFHRQVWLLCSASQVKKLTIGMYPPKVSPTFPTTVLPFVHDVCAGIFSLTGPTPSLSLLGDDEEYLIRTSVRKRFVAKSSPLWLLATDTARTQQPPAKTRSGKHSRSRGWGAVRHIPQRKTYGPPAQERYAPPQQWQEEETTCWRARGERTRGSLLYQACGQEGPC